MRIRKGQIFSHIFIIIRPIQTKQIGNWSVEDILTPRRASCCAGASVILGVSVADTRHNVRNRTFSFFVWPYSVFWSVLMNPQCEWVRQAERRGSWGLWKGEHMSSFEDDTPFCATCAPLAHNNGEPWRPRARRAHGRRGRGAANESSQSVCPRAFHTNDTFMTHQPLKEHFHPILMFNNFKSKVFIWWSST